MRAVLPVAALLFAVPVTAPAAASDYRATVTESAEGWTFGKPGAPLLAEYASFGCPHCGEFAQATGDRVDQLLKAGKLRLAFRPFLIFPQDRAAGMLARCVAPQRRLGFIKAVLLGQAEIRARLAAADGDDAVRGKLFSAELAGPQAHAQMLVEVSGLSELASSHGLAAQDQQRCLASAQNLQWLTEADLTARLNGITGTPTYVWKGVRQPTTTPEALLQLLPL